MAIEQDADLVVIDDLNAKKHAQYLGLSVTGTLGIILKCKQRGYIESIKPIIEQMLQNGFWVSDYVKKIILEQAGEE